MTPDEIIAVIIGVDDINALSRIESAAKQHRTAIGKARWKESVARHWELCRHWTRGTEIYCCATGTFIGGPIQRGDKLAVVHVWPRAKVLGVTFKGKRYDFPANECLRYNLRTVPPESAMDATERAIVNRLARIEYDLDI